MFVYRVKFKKNSGFVAKVFIIAESFTDAMKRFEEFQLHECQQTEHVSIKRLPILTSQKA